MADPAPDLREIVRTRLGAIMLNPLRMANVTCDTCTAPVAPQYTRCFRCYSDARQPGIPVARRVVPLSYAVVGKQSDIDMYRYKDPMSEDQRHRNPSYQRVLLLVLGFAATHAACLDLAATRPVTALTVVPSLRGRTGAHPLTAVSAPLPTHWARFELQAVRDVPEEQRRLVRPGHFTLPDRSVVIGRHVVVLDDCWVQGGHAQSAAASLLLMGAAEVTILVIARRIRPDYQRSLLETALREVLRDREYSLDICPVTGGSCPRSRSWT